MNTKSKIAARSLILGVGVALSGVTATGNAAGPDLPLLGLLSGGGSGLGVGPSGTGGLGGLGVLSGENSGSGGLLGLDLLDNDSLLGLQLGGAPLLDLGDAADPLADAAQDLGSQIRAGVAPVRGQATAIPGPDGQALDLAPLAGIAVGDGVDAADSLVGLGLASDNNVVNTNTVSAVIAGGNNTATGDLAGAAVIGGNAVGNGGLVGGSVIAGNNSGNGDLVGAAVLSGNNSGNGGLVGASVLSGSNSGNGGLLGVSVLSENNAGNGGLAGASVLSGNGTGNGGLLGLALASGANSGNSLGLQGGDLLSFLQVGAAAVDNATPSAGLLGVRAASLSSTRGNTLDLEALSDEQLLALSLFGNQLLATGGGVADLNAGLDDLRLGLLAALVEPRAQALSAAESGGPLDGAVPEIAVANLLELGIGPGVGDTGDRLLAVHLFSGSNVGNGDAISLSAIGAGNNANGNLLGVGVLEGDNSGNGGVAGAGLLSGNNVGLGGLLGAVVLSGNNSGQGGAAGAGVLSGNNSGVSGLTGLAGIGVINADGAGNGGAGGVAVGGGTDSGNGNFAGISAVLDQLDTLLNSGDRPLLDVSAVSGGDALTADLLDLSVLESGQIVDARLTGIPVLQIEDQADLIAAVEDLRDALRDAGQQLVPALVGLPGGDTLVLLLSTDLSEAVEDIAGIALGPVLDENGNVLGAALLRDRPDDVLPGLGLAALGGDNDGNGSLAGVALLSGDNSGNGGPLGAAVLSGDNSGGSSLTSVAVLNDGPAANPGNGGAGGLGDVSNPGTAPTDNPVAGLEDPSATGGTSDEDAQIAQAEPVAGDQQSGSDNADGPTDAGSGSSAEEDRIARDLEDSGTEAGQDCTVRVRDSEGARQDEVDCQRDPEASPLSN